MIKLAIAAGITLSAILCGMMTLRSSGLFPSSGSSRNSLGILSDIKEIFGLRPLGASNSQLNSKSGESPSFSYAGEGGYLPPKSDENDDNSNMTFRIFILPTTTPTNSPNTSTTLPTTTLPSSSTSQASTTTTTTSTTTTSTTTPSSTEKPELKEEAVSEATTVASTSSSPTPYSYQQDPSPAFKIDLIWTTLSPPSQISSENQVGLNQNPKAAASGQGSGLPNNGLYLPPNKEYLPPSSQQ